MMFRWQSEQTCEVSETAVKLDIELRGWICEKWSRDSYVDLVVDMGMCNFAAIQVKSFTGYTIPTITRHEPNGERNTSLYKDYNVHWIAGYHKDTRQIYYYSIEKYGLLDGKSIDIRKMPPDIFPERDVPCHTSSDRKKVIEPVSEGLMVFADNLPHIDP